MGSIITSFRIRFNNHKSSLNRFYKGERGIEGEHLFPRFCELEHHGLEEVQIKIIDKADRSNPTEREGFIPRGPNIKDFM